jgi:CheY-like chemotaxis protein
MLLGPNPFSYNPARILLIEDDPNDQRLLARALEKTGRHIPLNVAKDGESGLEYLSFALTREGTKTPAIVLSDIHLPGRSGWDVLEWIRRRPELSELGVLLWTSLPTPEGAERARRLGALRYFSKPKSLEGYATIAASLIAFLGD